MSARTCLVPNPGAKSHYRSISELDLESDFSNVAGFADAPSDSQQRNDLMHNYLKGAITPGTAVFIKARAAEPDQRPCFYRPRPLSASKGAILTRTRPGNCAERPVSYNTKLLLLTTRLQLRSRRRHERAPPLAATTPPKSCSAPLSASKGAILSRTRPTNCVEWPVSYNTKLLLLTTRLELRSRRRLE